MSESTSALGQTIQLFLEMAKHGAQGAYHRLAPKATAYLKALLYTSATALITIPTLGILKTVTGYAGFGYLMAVAAVFFTLILGLMWSPLSLLVGLLLGETHSPKTVGERYVRFVATVMFFELVAAMYISYIPLHRQLSSVPILLIAVVAVVLGSAIWGGWLSGRFYTLIATLMVIKITLSAFFPQTAEVMSKWREQLDSNIAQGLTDRHNPASATSQQQTPHQPPQAATQLVIRRDFTPNAWCDWIFIPPGEKFSMRIPGRVKIQWRTGEERKISPNDSLGIMPHQQFRLKGIEISGTAVITII